MENFDILRTQFQAKGIIPSINDELTTLWGRKIVHNTINGYGIIGTIRLDSYDLKWINLGLSRIFQYPPEIYILFKPNNKSDIYHNDTIYYKRVSGLSGNEYFKRIAYYLGGDLVGFRANLDVTINSIRDKADFIDVYFKIHGV